MSVSHPLPLPYCCILLPIGIYVSRCHLTSAPALQLPCKSSDLLAGLRGLLHALHSLWVAVLVLSQLYLLRLHLHSMARSQPEALD